MEVIGCHGALWITLIVALFACLSASSDVKSDDEYNNDDSLMPKTVAKRNVAYWARSGHRKFFLPPRSDKRNVAWLARSGGRDTVRFPSSNKRDLDTEGDEVDMTYEPFTDDEVEYIDDKTPFYLDKRNIASLVNSKTIPSFIRDYKRHIGSAMRFRGSSAPNHNNYDRPDKRYFASLLKSENHPVTALSKVNSWYNFYEKPTSSKRFFSSLLENDYGAPGEDDIDKRSFNSLLKSDKPFNVKRSFSSLLKSDSGIGMSGKNYYSSLLDNTKSEDKRFVASLLKSKDLQDIEQLPSNQLLSSIYNRQIQDIDKRHLSSLINRVNSYSNGKHITKRHIGSLRDSSKRFYGSLLDDFKGDDPYNDKRSFGSLLKSSSYQSHDKKNVGSAMRYRQGKRGPEDEALTVEEIELDDLEKRFLGSLMDTTANEKLYGHSPGKRHFPSLLDNRDVRSNVLFDEEAYPLEENDDDKRHISSLLGSRSAADKRFLGSLLNSDTPYTNIHDVKRYIGSAINSRMAFKNDGKRFLGSTLNSRMNFKNDDKRFIGSTLKFKPMPETDKRFIGSIVQSREDNMNEGKPFYASVLDNSRDSTDAGTVGPNEKRFLGSTLKSKSYNTNEDKRSNRDLVNGHDGPQSPLLRPKRDIDYFDDGLDEDDQEALSPNLEDSEGINMLWKPPVKRFLPPMARKNWFPEFYYYGYGD